MNVKCPDCLGNALLDTDWSAPIGYDPRLKRFVCEETHLCGCVFFKVLSTGQIDKLLKDLSKP